jgi:hypothetical protein
MEFEVEMNLTLAMFSQFPYAALIGAGGVALDEGGFGGEAEHF